MPRAFLFLLLILYFQTGLAQVNSDVLPKVSPALKLILDKEPVDSIDVYITLNAKSTNNVHEYRVLASHQLSHTYLVRAKASAVKELSEKSRVKFMDVYIAPKEEITTGSIDLATNKANISHYKYPTVTGSEIVVSVKENRLDTADIDYAGRYINSNISSPLNTAHASIVATILAGGANSSPYAKGVAFGSHITSSNFANLFPDTDSIFKKYNISVQNHSYGTVIQNYYGAEALAYDVHVYANPHIAHVFSSGNTGTSNATSGIYTSVAGFSNLTGNFKMAKNILTVGAVDSFFNVATLSSKGPAYDGRLKPELVAFGQDGTSGAAALVSGAAALVQHAYKQQHNSTPSFALVKAVLINSADDINNKHLDFVTGYGNLNVYKAVKTIVENNFYEDVLAANQTKKFSISIPSGISKIKLTTSWVDPAATVNAPKALVNDIDITFVNVITGEVWQPWVLNHYPHKDSLLSIATRKIDTLNVVEQITIENPAAGDYEIIINGGKITTANQAFAISYQLDSADVFEWTFPIRDDHIQSGNSNILRWETTKTGSGTIEYSDGGSWQPVATVQDVSAGYAVWDAPDVFSKGILRMKISSSVHLSDTFVLSKATTLSSAFNCKDSFMLYWNKLNVDAYQLYHLKDKYLQPLLLTKDSFKVFQKQQNIAKYYSVAPVVAGRTGLKSFILNYDAQINDCYFKSFYLQTQSSSDATFAASLGTVYGVKQISFQKLLNQKYVTLKYIDQPSVTSFMFVDSALLTGVNMYRLQIVMQNGSTMHSSPISIYHFGNSDLIVYPNPVNQGQDLNFITTKAGRMKIEIFNSGGLMIKQFALNNLFNQRTTISLSKGIYFIKSTADDGDVSSQKLIVY